MVKRGADYFVPRGGTLLELGDKLLVITDNTDELRQELKQLGVDC
jgi:cell volume regulation protein A